MQYPTVEVIEIRRAKVGDRAYGEGLRYGRNADLRIRLRCQGVETKFIPLCANHWLEDLYEVVATAAGVR